MHHVRCRAKLVGSCLDGRPTTQQFGDDLPLTEDGTFRHSNPPGEGTIICDPCYIAIMPHTPSGQALHGELDAGIEAARKAIHGAA